MFNIMVIELIRAHLQYIYIYIYATIIIQVFFFFFFFFFEKIQFSLPNYVPFLWHLAHKTLKNDI